MFEDERSRLDAEEPLARGPHGEAVGRAERAFGNGQRERHRRRRHTATELQEQGHAFCVVTRRRGRADRHRGSRGARRRRYRGDGAHAGQGSAKLRRRPIGARTRHEGGEQRARRRPHHRRALFDHSPTHQRFIAHLVEDPKACSHRRVRRLAVPLLVSLLPALALPALAGCGRIKSVAKRVLRGDDSAESSAAPPGHERPRGGHAHRASPSHPARAKDPRDVARSAWRPPRPRGRRSTPSAHPK